MKLVSITDTWLEIVVPAHDAKLAKMIVDGYEKRTTANGRTLLARCIVALTEMGIVVFWPGVPEEYVVKRTGRKGLFFECDDVVLAVVTLKLFSDISAITELDES